MLFAMTLALAFLSASGQDDAVYLKANAVRIDNPDNLSDAVYNLLSPYKIIMFGEMHGTNEAAQFVTALTNLLTSKGDSVSVGLEIPSAQMKEFISQRTDSSIYTSSFFLHPAFESGKESVAWASLISKLKDNAKVQLFFYDVNDNDGKSYPRDSMMYAKMKTQFKKHPAWKMVTLSGNYHNKLSNKTSMTSFLQRDKELNISAKICSLNLEYSEGTCRADFGQGLEVKKLGHPDRVYDTAPGFNKYLVLVSSKSSYEYSGFYYTKNITAATMTRHE
jgi:hypothetical protein